MDPFDSVVLSLVPSLASAQLTAAYLYAAHPCSNFNCSSFCPQTSDPSTTRGGQKFCKIVVGGLRIEDSNVKFVEQLKCSDRTIETGSIFSPLSSVMNMLISLCALIVPWHPAPSPSHQNLNRFDKLDLVRDLSLGFPNDEDYV